jgi:hypothetical protein
MLERQRDQHKVEAVAQRREMNLQINAALEEYRASVAGRDPAPAEAPCAEEIDSQPSDEEAEVEQAPPARPPARRTLVQCEDYGQSIAIPHYGLRRPAVDYFLRRLLLLLFSASHFAVQPPPSSVRHCGHDAECLHGPALRRTCGGQGRQRDSFLAVELLPETLSRGGGSWDAEARHTGPRQLFWTEQVCRHVSL